MTPQITEGQWLRSPARTLAIGVILVGYGLPLAWLALADRAHTTSGWITAVALLLAAPGIVLGLRALRAGLWIDSETVIVRGLLRTSRLAAAEVEGFRAEKRLAPCPVLYRKHGAAVSVASIGRGGLSRASEARDLRMVSSTCDQLNALLDRVRSDVAA